MRMLFRSSVGLMVVAIGLSACQPDGLAEDDGLSDSLAAAIRASTGGDPEMLKLPSSEELEKLPQDPRNPLTPEKVALGKLLYHDPGLGVEGTIPGMLQTYSCASCHHAAAGFQAGRVQGIGEGGIGFGARGEGRNRAANVRGEMLDVQPIKSPSILNAGYQKLMIWNGQFGATDANVGTESEWTPGTPKEVNRLGFEGVETQAIAGMRVHRQSLNRELAERLNYIELFDRAFPDIPQEERYTNITSGLAIAAFERTVVANQAPFQRWLAGNPNAMTAQQLRGAIVFFDKGNCASCHSGPSLANMSFHALGFKDLHDCPDPVHQSFEGQATHLGRGGFTMRGEDMYKFKTPQLYNLDDSKFYGHGATQRSIREVVEYKNEAIPENPRVPASAIDPAFQPLGLSEREIDDLVAFLEDGLRDPNLKRYEPQALPSNLCFPNADPLSRHDLNCN